jgi:phosphoadenosine phosphosulfate reductase
MGASVMSTVTPGSSPATLGRPAASSNYTASATWNELGVRAEAWGAERTLRWAEATFAPRLTLATGFGAEGCVLIDLAARMGLNVDIFTLDTGVLFPETYDLWKRLEERYGITIKAVRPAQTLEEQARSYGDRLWEREPEKCCALRKVAPLGPALKGYDAWVTAIRRDQTANRASALPVEWDAKNGLVKVNPLVRWQKEAIWAYIQEWDVPYNALHDKGYPSISCHTCTSPVKPGEDDRAGRWRGNEKTECGLHVIPVTPVPATEETRA